MQKRAIALSVALLASPSLGSAADSSAGPQVNLGAILDGRYQDGEREFSETEDGFGLGHTEISLDANIDHRFRGRLTTVLESHDGDIELELEEAFVETLGLPGGLNLRAGRMLSQFGYLNSRHLHEDDFPHRPGAYRAYLGDHYFDDGLGAELVLPTNQYVKFGFEAFDGDKLAASSVPGHARDTVNVLGGQIKTGGDINDSNSWQLGVSLLHNRSGSAMASFDLPDHDHHDEHDEDHDDGHDADHHRHAGDHDEHDDDHEDDHGHEHGNGNGHGHAHGPAVTGENLYGVDFTWKWAPDGNYREQNVVFTAEYLLLDDLLDNTLAQVQGAPDDLSGWYLSLAWQFAPQWTAAVRYGEAETFHSHDVGLHDGDLEGQYDVDRLKEIDLSLAWSPSHFSTVRAAYTRETQRVHGHSNDENIFMLQYVMSLGAHGAHRF
ncbi:MAG: hypothetical protein U5R46_18395 [Gammaproteobacteria bacterium]|nr:hypothetical protein [Gammaproteobacteria bacterium]